jgi:KDO2-lipid IV(A) lauroyltransferase
VTDFSYSFRSSVFAPERHYLLTPDRLTWTGNSDGAVAYDAIAKIKVYQARFWGSSRSYWTCILYPYQGKKIHLGAAHRLQGRAIEDRTETYIPFVKELEARIAAANGNAQLVTGRGLLSWVEGAAGWIAVQILQIFRHFDCDGSSNAVARFMRILGPRLRGHRLARAQLTTSFPEKNPQDIEIILDGMWDNMGRVIAEYAHLDSLWDFYPARPETAKRILIDRVVADRLLRLGKDSGPALMFGSHLANWELLALAATAHGRDIVLVYRQPKIVSIANEIIKLRGSGVAGLIPAGSDAPLKVRSALRQNRLVGMLVDQHDANGIKVSFFGRSCRVNGMLGRVARLFECPIYGARVIRLSDHRYRFEMTEPLTPPRDHKGKIDAAGTMQMVTSMIESWVRDHPEQWMWTHRRWR